jgi:nucleoside-diphosphate-sugar epimerase
MRVILTGAAGFIGSHVLCCLRRYGIPFVAVGRTIPHDCSEAEFIHSDLLMESDFDRLIARAGATHLLHLAWYAEHGKYWTSPLNLRWAEASVRLTEAFCKAGGSRVVVAGTCAEYDWTYGYCREGITPENPATLYGVAKDATRRLVMCLCREYDVPCAWGRIFITYGPGENALRLIPSLIRVFMNKKEPFAVSPSNYRDFVYVEDVAEAFFILMSHDETGIYNICSGQPVQLASLVKLAAVSLNADPGMILDLALHTYKELT